MKRVLIAIAVAFLLVIAGCADTSDDNPEDDIEDPTETEDPQDSPDDGQSPENQTEQTDAAEDESTDDKDPPESDTDSNTDADTDSDTDSETDSGDDSETDTSTDSETDSNSLSDSDSSSDADSDSKTDSDTDTDSSSDAGPDDDDSTEDVSSGDGTLEIHAINVGQADATLLIGPTGETMLIDSGDWTDDGEAVLDYLEARGIDHLDHLVATHGHADHIGGHAAIIQTFESEKDGIGQVWDSGVVHTSQTYERYLDAIETHDVTLFETQAGDEVPMEGLDVTVLNPPADSSSSGDLHANSVVVHVEHGEVGFIATGDSEASTEQQLVDEYGTSLEAEIYQAGHHGSSTSSSESFLDAVDPELAIISSAYDSTYGHPHEEVLNRFATDGIPAVWTATHGSTVITSDGESFTVQAQADAPTSPTDLRDAPAVSVGPTVRPTEELTLAEPADMAPSDGNDESDDDTDNSGSDDEDSSSDSDGGDASDSALSLNPTTAGATATHTWSFDDLDFTGEIDSIEVTYPDGTSLDGVTNEDVTVTMTRSMADGLDTSEIRVNTGSYSGSRATFDLDGRYNTDVVGFVEVVIEGVENPPAGDRTATITFIGESDEVSITEPLTTE